MVLTVDNKKQDHIFKDRKPIFRSFKAILRQEIAKKKKSAAAKPIFRENYKF